jgi:phosphatidylserine decarboxylase
MALPFIAPWGTKEVVIYGALPLVGAALSAAILVPLDLVYVGWTLTAVLGAFGLFSISFFRCPNRKIPEGADLLVSPADGTVSHIEETDDPLWVGGRVTRISIFLSVFNVHVNRSPAASIVGLVRHTDGKYLDARHPNCHIENEAQDIGLTLTDGSARGTRVLMRQISGAIARHIVCPREDGRVLTRGEWWGMIKCGTRTDLLIPIEEGLVFEPAIKVGSKVSGGSSILGTLRRAEGAA